MKNTFKASITLAFTIAMIFGLYVAADFSSYTTGNTSQVVSATRANIHQISIVNPGSDSLYVFLYNLPTASTATYTTTPTGRPFYCPPHEQIYLNRSSFSSPEFSNGIQIRTVVRGSVTIPSYSVNPSWGSIRTSTVSPTYKPQIDINYYNQ